MVGFKQKPIESCYVAWPSNDGFYGEACFAIAASELLLYSAPERNVHPAVEGREVLPDFIVGDHVRWTKDNALSRLPDGDIGRVTGFLSSDQVTVVFSGVGSNGRVVADDLKKNLDPAQLTLEVAHAEGDEATHVVRAYKNATVDHVGLWLEQTDANEAHEALLEELEVKSERELKKWAKKKVRLHHHHPEGKGIPRGGVLLLAHLGDAQQAKQNILPRVCRPATLAVPGQA
eukprot:SAG11_NODE_191_length_12943_cov_3.853706_4_plen_232_part_00